MGTSRREAAYATKAMDVEELDEADAFEKAIEASLARAMKPKTSGKSTASNDLDPLGLEAGFDELHGPMAPDASLDSATESSCAPSSASTGEPSESDREGRDALSDDGADQVGAGSSGVVQASEHYDRRGNRLFWKGKVLAHLTSWGRNVSCHCKVHEKCKTPASTSYASDSTLVDWALSAIDMEGRLRITRAQHLELAVAMAGRARVPVAATAAF